MTQPPAPTGDAWLDHLLSAEFKRFRNKSPKASNKTTLEICEAIIADREAGMTYHQLADKFSIGYSTIRRVCCDGSSNKKRENA